MEFFFFGLSFSLVLLLLQENAKKKREIQVLKNSIEITSMKISSLEKGISIFHESNELDDFASGSVAVFLNRCVDILSHLDKIRFRQG